MILLDIIAAYLVVLGLSLIFTPSRFVLEAPLVIPRLLANLWRRSKKKRRERVNGEIEVESQGSNWTAGDDR